MATQTSIGQLLISADSHVVEDPQFWVQNLPADLAEHLPQFRARVSTAVHSATALNAQRPGGWDPTERVKEMAEDSVSAEILYPSLGLRLFSVEHAAAQEAAFASYNDWLIEYCQSAPERLYGIACISCYNIDNAVKELERAKKAGMIGALIWQVPHDDMPFTSEHHEKLWAAAAALNMPVHLHILTGFDYNAKGFDARGNGIEAYRGSVNLKLGSATNAMFDLIFSGVLDRHPALKFVFVESEIGWIPFMLQQWDFYFNRFRNDRVVPIDEAPSTYFNRQMYATFFNDPVGGTLLSSWGTDNCMWSTDYPHANSSWPHSRELAETNLGHLSQETITKLVTGNVAKLYDLELPEALGV